MGKLLSLAMSAKSLLQGKKTYAVGLAMILQGAAGMLNKIVALNGLGDIMSLISNGATDPAMQMLMLGVAIMTGRAGLDNANKPLLDK